MKVFIHYPQFIRHIQLVGCLWLLGAYQLAAQPSIRKTAHDSLKIVALNEQFVQALKQKKYTQAANYGKEALEFADKHLYVHGKINTLWLFGNLYTQTNQVAEALTNYLEAESLCQNFNIQKQLVKVYDELGLFYQRQGLYSKAIQYFRQAYKIRQQKNYSPGVGQNLEHIAHSYFITGNYIQAYVFYEKLLGFYKKKRQKDKEIETLEQLALITSYTKSYSKAIGYQQTLLKHYQKKKSKVQVSSTYNNLGFLYQRRQDIQTAINYFSLSSEVIAQGSQLATPANQITLLINTGVAYTNIEAFSKARKYFRQALKMTQNDLLKQAEIYNYLASNYYLTGNSFQAFVEVEKAINIALPKKSWPILLTSYDILSRLHLAEGNKKKAEEFRQKYRQLSRKTRRDKQQKDQEASHNLRLMEKQEIRIKELLAEKRQLKELKNVQEKQKKDLVLKNNLVKLQQQELALLKKAKELDNANAQRFLLEKVRQEQALLISKGKLREANLARAKTLTALKLERKEAEKKLQEKENQKKLALLEKEKKIQQQEIKQQKAKVRYVTGIIISVVSILGLVLSLLLITNRNRRKLKKQKAKIEEQNEEITSQRDHIQTTNQLLNRQNQHIQQSIQAALTIQEAILPDATQIAALLPENFILYRPKDVVSGDFYWLKKIGNKTVLAAVDCTGHGVPGAFMSMIGNNLLNRIAQRQNIHEPKNILTALNNGVEKVLRQKEKGYKNGMDLALVIWEEKGDHIELVFAGAKRHIYYFQKGDSTIHKINPSRYSIGFADPEFHQERFELAKGDTMYLSSDGYVDQNNAKRKKFGSKRFEQMLAKHQTLTMIEQQKIMEDALDEHMQGEEQRDDILVIGIRF